MASATLNIGTDNDNVGFLVEYTESDPSDCWNLVSANGAFQLNSVMAALFAAVSLF